MKFVSVKLHIARSCANKLHTEFGFNIFAEIVSAQRHMYAVLLGNIWLEQFYPFNSTCLWSKLCEAQLCDREVETKPVIFQEVAWFIDWEWTKWAAQKLELF